MTLYEKADRQEQSAKNTHRAGKQIERESDEEKWERERKIEIQG